MQVYRRSSALPVLVAALLAGCRGETPTDPTSTTAIPTPGPTAALVGAPNTWEQVAPMPSARYYAVAGSAVNANGRSILYVFAGRDLDDIEGVRDFGTVEAYNIATNRWTTKAGIAPVEVSAINGVGYVNGKFYLPGGKFYTGDGYLKRRVLQVYDPVADVWTRGADMPGTSAAGVAGVIDNRLYVLTGEDNTYLPDGTACEDCGIVYTRRLFRYNPVQNRWVRHKSCPNFHVDGVAGVIQGKLYVTGGRGDGGTKRSLDVYHPATNTWTSGAPLPSVHVGGVGVVLAGQFYVIGGFTGEVVAYNPNTNRWVKKAPFPVPTARFMTGAKVTLDGKARIVVQVGLEDGFPNNGRATFVYTP
jgi:N-acetylneuraminic acid mutarotase